MTDKETSWISFSSDGKYFVALYIADKQRLAVFSAETNQIISQFDLPKTGTLYMGSRWTPDSRSVLYKDEVEGIWKQAIEGGEPERLPGFTDIRVFHLGFDTAGKLTFSGGLQMRQIVILEPPSESSQIQ